MRFNSMKKEIRLTFVFKYCMAIWFWVLSSALLGQTPTWEEKSVTYTNAKNQDETLTYLKLNDENNKLHRALLYAPTSVGYPEGMRRPVLSQKFLREYQVHQKDPKETGTHHWMSMASVDAQALSNQIWHFATSLEDVYLITNFELLEPKALVQPKSWCRNALMKRPYLEDGDEGFNDALGYFLGVQTSSTCQPRMLAVREKNFKIPQVNIFFKNPESLYQEFNSKEVMTWKVLQAMLELPNSTFRQKLVESGLNVESGLVDAKHKGLLAFSLKTNPKGIKASIDSFFAEVNKMHRFDYSTVEQLEFAKKVIRNNWAHEADKFEKLALSLADYYAYGELAGYRKRDSLLATITKVDLMSCIRTYIQNRPFHVELWKEGDDGFNLRNSLGPEVCELYYGFGNWKLTEEHKVVLDELLYTLNLSPKGTVVVLVTKQKKRKLEAKRGDAVISYLEERNNSMNFKLKVIKMENSTPDVTFTYEQDD